jgi:hypothetical protein
MNLKELNKSGIASGNAKIQNTLVDLRKNTPGMILIESKDSFSFSLNHGNPIFWKKGDIRLLSIYLYTTMKFNKKTGKSRLMRIPKALLFGTIFQN